MKWLTAILQRIVAGLNVLFPPVPYLQDGLRQLTKGQQPPALWVPDESLFEGKIAPWTIREIQDCATIGGQTVSLETMQVDGIWLVILTDYKPVNPTLLSTHLRTT